MIKRIIGCSRLVQLNLPFQRLAFKSTNLVLINDKQEVSKIDTIQSLPALFKYYRKNKRFFSPILYGRFCRKISTIMKEKQNSIQFDVDNNSNIKLFIKDLAQLNFQQINAQQIKQILLISYRFNKDENCGDQLFNPLKLKLLKRVYQLVTQNKLNFNQIIDILNSLHHVTHDIQVVVDKIEEILISDKIQFMKQRNKISPQQLLLALNAFSWKLQLSEKQKKVINQLQNIINVSMLEISLALKVKIMITLNRLRLNMNIKYTTFLINKLVNTVNQNLTQLSPTSILEILSFSHKKEDSKFSPIYQAIQHNLFDLILENGQEFNKNNLLFQIIYSLSKKEKFIHKPKKQWLLHLLTLVEIKVSNDYKTITKKLDFLVNAQYFKQQTIEQIRKTFLKFKQKIFSQQFICEMFNKKLDILPFFDNIEKLDLSKDFIYFIKIALAILKCYKMNPNDQNIFNKLNEIKRKVQTININCLKILATMKQKNVAVNFHTSFSYLYKNKFSNSRLMEKDNINWYINFIVFINQEVFLISNHLGQLTQSLKNAYIYFFESNAQYQKWNQSQMRKIIRLIKDILPQVIQKKENALFSSILQFARSKQVKKYATNGKNFELYRIIFFNFRPRLILVCQFEGLNDFLNKINQEDSNRIVSSLQYYSFLTQCKNHIFKIKNQTNKKVLSIALNEFNLLNQQQQEKLGLNKQNKQEDSNPKACFKQPYKLLFSSKQLNADDRQMILNSISTMNNKTIQYSIIKCKLLNTSLNQQILEKLVTKLLSNNPNWRQIKIFAIINTLKIRYRMKNSKIFQNFCQEVIKKQAHNHLAYQLSQDEIFAIMRQCKQAKINIYKQVQEMQIYFVKNRLNNYKKYEFLLKNANKLIPKLIQMIDLFPKKALWFSILAESQIKNAQQKFKSLIKICKYQDYQISWCERKYISNKYPNLKSLFQQDKQQERQQKLILLDLNGYQMLKKIESKGLGKVKKIEMDKLNSYYQFNGIPVILSQNILISTQLDCLIQQRIISVIIRRPVIVYNSNTDLLKKLTDQFPYLLKLQAQLFDATQQLYEAQIIKVAEKPAKQITINQKRN